MAWILPECKVKNDKSTMIFTGLLAVPPLRTLARNRDPEEPTMPARQQLLVLWLSTSDPGAGVCAWSRYDAAGDDTGKSGDQDQPPYGSALAARRDGWRLLQYPQARMSPSGDEFRLGFLKHEFVLERLVETA